MIDLNTPYKHYSNVVFTELNEKEASVLNLDSKRYYSLNDTGIFVWKLLENSISGNGIIEKVCDTYSGDKEEITNFVQKFLSELSNEKLIVS